MPRLNCIEPYSHHLSAGRQLCSNRLENLPREKRPRCKECCHETNSFCHVFCCVLGNRFWMKVLDKIKEGSEITWNNLAYLRNKFYYFPWWSIYQTVTHKPYCVSALQNECRVGYSVVHNYWSSQRFSQDYNLASHTTHVVYVNFIHEWLDLQLKVDSERQRTFLLQFHSLLNIY